MKFGIRLLLVVALLLPLRGAMAVVGALCHADPGALPAAAAVHADHAAHALPAAGHSHPAHAAAAPDHAADPDARADAAQPDGSSCTFCTAVCSTPPLPVAGISVHATTTAGAERFPALASPRSTSAYDALERPPRAA